MVQKIEKDYAYVPLKEVRKKLEKASSSSNGKVVLDILQEIIPELSEDVSSAVVSLNVGLNLPRIHTGISRTYPWSAPRNAKEAGFSAQQRLEWSGELLSLLDKIQDTWPVDQLELIVAKNGVVYDWSLASGLSNFNVWKSAATAKNTFAAPQITPTTSSRDFTTTVYAVVVNPEQPDQVWGVGPEIALPENFSKLSPKEKERVWENLLEDSRGQLMEEFKFDALPTRFHQPQLRLRWNVVAPDQKTWAYSQTSSSDWVKTNQGAAWLNKISEEIAQSYVKAGQWITYKKLADAGAVSVREKMNGYMSEKEWDYIGFPPPQSDEDVEAIMGFLKKTNKNKYDVVSKEVRTTVFSELQNLDNLRFRLLPEMREWFAQLPWLDDLQALSQYVDQEKTFVTKNVGSLSSMEDMLERFGGEGYHNFIEVLMWNDIELSNDIVEQLFPKPQVIESENIVVEAPKREVYTSTTDWSDLTSAFSVEYVEEQSASLHPFIRWMDRLSPPKDVDQKTQSWLADNESFNTINRSILKEKDGDEAALNAQLADKLKNVMQVSTQILQENRQNNGWFGRLRNNFKEGGSSDNWADAFMDFQNHMIVMYTRINQQVERDRLWLRYADDLIAKSETVDSAWANWLSTSAQNLENERNSKPNATSEEKMNWNGRVDVLQSASVAHDHIKTANAVTGVLLEKVRQSIQIKERLQQRSMMFYWSSLSMFAGLQSMQRNANGLFEQAEMVAEMTKSYNSLTSRTLTEEIREKERIREAFKEMTSSKESMENFYKTIAEYQKDTVAILGDLNAVRVQTQEETVASLSMESVKQKRKSKAKTMTVEAPVADTSSRTNSRGP